MYVPQNRITSKDWSRYQKILFQNAKIQLFLDLYMLYILINNEFGEVEESRASRGSITSLEFRFHMNGFFYVLFIIIIFLQIDTRFFVTC